jgi:hypothetical protein
MRSRIRIRINEKLDPDPHFNFTDPHPWYRVTTYWYQCWGSGTGAAFRYGSGDPDLNQNVTDPQHWLVCILKTEAAASDANLELKN